MTRAAFMSAPAMPRHRLWTAHAAIAVIVGGSLACIATDREYWPFSQYEMFSYPVATQPYAEIALMAVPAAGGEEFSLRPHKYIKPFDWPRQRVALERLLARPDRDQALPRALADVARRYDLRRSRHRGPALQAVRFYRFEWDGVDPHEPSSAEPDRMARRVLLAEWRAGGEGR